MQSADPGGRARRPFAGVLLGTAVGDALGLPAEGLRPSVIRRRWKGGWRMRLLPGRGMISDDTEHTLMIAGSLLAHPGDPEAFQRAFARRLRWWFLALPAGVGLATLRACLKLWLGFPPPRSAVRSGGAGPAMRSAILGAYFAADPEARRRFVTASTRVTHSGWQAETAALAVAEAAAWAVRSHGPPAPGEVLAALSGLSAEPEWIGRLRDIEAGLASGASTPEFALRLGLARGVTGYALHVVPVALYAWLRHPGDFRAALTGALDCGGDTDTVGAVAGALAGAAGGAAGGAESIPADWLGGLRDWPNSARHMNDLAAALGALRNGSAPPAVRRFAPAVLPRNVFFLAVVLVHGFRRLLPPY